MKTYLITWIDRLKNWDRSLDAKAILCKQSWLVFNDSGEQQMLIFDFDGRFRTFVNGCQKSDGRWEYIQQNGSITINTHGRTYMYYPAIKDDALTILQLAGTQKYTILLSEAKVKKLLIKSIDDMRMYLENKDSYKQKLKDEERRQEEVKIRKRNEEIKRKEQLSAKRRTEWEKMIDRKVKEYCSSNEYKKQKNYWAKCIKIGAFVTIITVIFAFVFTRAFLLVTFLSLLITIISIYAHRTVESVRRGEIIEKYPFKE